MIDQESHYDIAARLSINWMNGNLSDTIEEILSYEPIDSSVILVHLINLMDKSMANQLLHSLGRRANLYPKRISNESSA